MKTKKASARNIPVTCIQQGRGLSEGRQQRQPHHKRLASLTVVSHWLQSRAAKRAIRFQKSVNT